jgi:glycosyltransferase involved in cell wall biosynthesis
MSNAIDPERFQLDNNKKGLIREKYQIHQDIIIGFVGAFVEWHGIRFMLNSLCNLLQAKNIHILIVGDGPIRSEIEQQILNLNIKEFVTITGFIDADEVPRYISDMDICVMPDSNTHGSPVKIFEYMAMGKPIVAPAYEPITEVLTDHIDSMLFPPKDSKAFADRIVELIEDKDLMKRIGKNAQEKVFKKHTWSQHAKDIIRLYQTVGIIND